MKNFLYILCFLVLAGSAKVQAQTVDTNRLCGTISVFDETYLPTNQNTKAPNDLCIFSFPRLNAIALKFNLVRMEQTFPGASGQYLRSICSVTMNSYDLLDSLEHAYPQIFAGSVPCLSTGQNGPTGITQTASRKESNLHLAPNPALEELTISLPAVPASAIIYNVAGQKMWMLQDSKKDIKVDCSQWPQGLYILRLQDKAGSVSSEIFIRQ